jgi:hypothetical protein
MKVLIDRNIEREAVVYHSVEVPKTLRWGDYDCTMPVLERQERLPRDDEVFRKDQLPYLATVSELARTVRLGLFVSAELVAERWRQGSPDQGYVGLNILEGVQIGKVKPPVDRTMVVGLLRRSAREWKDEQVQFFRSVQDSRFLAIRAAVSDPRNPEAHIGDAFHLWTAEVAGLDVFLTMDQRFLNVMSGKGKRAKSPVPVLSPKDLCASLGEGPTDLAVLAAKYPPFR